MDENTLTNPEEGVAGETEEIVEDRAEEVTEEEPTGESPNEKAEGLEEEEPTEEYEEIVWNGETKKLTKEELRELAQKGFDYTQKTQQVSEAWKALETEYRQMQEQKQLNDILLDKKAEIRAIDTQLEQLNNVNWAELAASDPAVYTELDAQYKQLQRMKQEAEQGYQQAAAQYEQSQQQIVQQQVQKEMEKLVEKIPEWRDPAKFERAKAEIREGMKDYGFADDEIAQIMDHRALLVIKDALEYRKLKSQKPEPKPITKAPPPPKKVGSGKSAAPDPNKMSIDEWMEWRNKQLRKKNKR